MSSPPAPETDTEPGAAPSTPQQAPRRGRGRSVGAVACLVVAALLTTPAVLAYWGQRTLNDTQRYVDTVGPLINSPQVQEAIVTNVTDAIEKQVDVEAILNTVFAGVINDRPRLAALVGPLSGAVDGFIETQVRNFVASPAFADLWVQVNTKAQEAFVRLLQGDNSGAVSLQGDQVVLDLSAVIDQVKQRLVDRGLTIVANIPVPNVDKQIVLLDAPQLRQARSIYAFANPIARWLILVVALLFLAAVALARRRPRMVVTVGAVLVANALLLAFALSVARQLFVDHLSGTVFGPASSVFYDTLLSYLERGWRVMAWLGLIVLLAGLFAGPNRVGTVVRTDVRNGLEGVGAKLADGPVATSGRWVRANIRWLRVAVCLVGAVILLWGVDVSVARLGWSFLFVVVVLAVLQVLVGAGRSTTVGGPGSAGEPESQDSEAGGGPTPAAASAP